MIHPAQGVQMTIIQEYLQKLGDCIKKPPPKQKHITSGHPYKEWDFASNHDNYKQNSPV